MIDQAQGSRRRQWLLNVGALCVGAAGALHARSALANAGDGASQVALAADAPGQAASAAPRPVPAEPIRKIDDLGVELVAVRLAASDFLIDLRYRVKDVARAQPLLERKLLPVLVNESTGDRYYIPQAPKVGMLKQSATSKQPAMVDRVYFMLFANPDRKLKAGEKVTLYAGDSVVKDLVVQ